MITRALFGKSAGCLAVLIGLTVLVGWALDVPLLKSFFQGLVTMKANTALGILLGGVVLLLLSRPGPGRTVRGVSGAAAGLVIALGAATLGEYFSGGNFGIDEWLFPDPTGSIGTSQPGRMSPTTAFTFMLTGAALLTATSAVLSGWRLSFLSAVGATVTIISGIATLGQISNALFDFRFWNYLGMAIQTAIGFLLLGTGLLMLPGRTGRLRWDLDRKTTFGFAVAVAILVTATGVSWNHTRQLVQIVHTISHAGPVDSGVLTEREKEADSISTTALLFLPLGTFLSLSVLSFALFHLNSGMTAQKKAEEDTARLAAIVNSSHDAIMGKDISSVVTSWNEGARKMFGYTAEEMVGQSVRRIIPADRQQEEMGIIDKIRHGAVVEPFDTVRVAKDGREIEVSLTVSPIKDPAGRIIGASGVARDVTQKHAAEEEIRQLNAHLEERVAERTAELEAANKELEAFSYSVSHDLRAPLRAVNGFSQAVLEDYGAQLPEQGRTYLKRIRDGAKRMGVLIDDLLTFSRLSRMPLKRQEINTEQQVRHVLDDLQDQKKGRQVEIEIGDLPATRGSPAMLEQIWTNLLSNALKYTRPRQPARIEVGCQADNGEEVYFVRDNGTGFDMRYANKLFGVFQRLHRPEEFEGTGVGLAIVHRIVQRHGGRVWADAAPDKGATFYFTLNGKAESE